MQHTTQTLVNISNAVRTADGWYDATVRAVARFSTEALRDAAIAGVASMHTSERTRFASSVTSYEIGAIDRMSRERACELLCSWAHVVRMRDFAQQMDRARAAATAEFPSAYEALGAAL